ncbi:MAG: peptide deformylase [Ferrovum sp. 37-45-19]|uniref:peptide deformylase n=1 Tax=Ferrovum sp. JA12 TaxID=1356299 RepID=UPI000702533B|nr:peptide deformylase [Ferrovum sp. JA12]OYV80680.1 MAG: peptide deformylase [Ferrovum sp. 21-44-67]OYV95231.1 MAG: peptide deformylase [Ferrovum sp. 37-45-19]OZB33749.1 MAG: peptide deformylase [Ferrovum sp. 34-44-207]HQT80734.1 peptide deformylase [Ferrovaceae bacterium]KRH79827.1 peptide deformylase [Ferrovum sp. JA12]
MAIRPVLRMGHPILKEIAKPVENVDDPFLLSLLTDMFDTMAHLDGAGLAAPQIGVSLRVVIFGVKHNSRYPDVEEVPMTVLINPTITPLSVEMNEDWEGCLSVPGLRGRVPRYSHLRYQGMNERGEVIDRTVSGFHARVVQHECDHLDGVLYPMRIRDFNTFGFSQELGIDTPDD